MQPSTCEHLNWQLKAEASTVMGVLAVSLGSYTMSCWKQSIRILLVGASVSQPRPTRLQHVAFFFPDHCETSSELQASS